MSYKYFLCFWLFYFAYGEFGGDELVSFHHTETFYLYIEKCIDLIFYSWRIRCSQKALPHKVIKTWAAECLVLPISVPSFSKL